MVMACAYDEGIPDNENREYTIAISRAEDKPKNAGAVFCGVAWIPWSREGDGEEAPETNEEFGMLQMRTMLPNRPFGPRRAERRQSRHNGFSVDRAVAKRGANRHQNSQVNCRLKDLETPRNRNKDITVMQLIPHPFLKDGQ